MSNKIENFTGEYFFLSNFYPQGSLTHTVEHQFQAAKALDPQEKKWVLSAKNANEAKKRGRKVDLRPDWEQVKLDVMRACLAEKFSSSTLRAQLLATGDAELVEGNWWGDQFWGVCHGKGENWLGRLLMELRAKLRSEA